MCSEIFHKPVMLREVIELLEPSPGQTIVDGTVGEGGHAERIASLLRPDGLLIGIDKDERSLETARERLKEGGTDFRLFKGSYADIKKFLREAGVKEVNGVLLDLGLSTKQLKNGGRGFSFKEDEPLDMRFDTSRGKPAWKWLREASEEEIKEVLKKLGQEKEGAVISRALKKLTERKKDITARSLAETVAEAKRKKGKRTHPATKTFQAIRIYVNNELEELKRGLREGIEILSRGGRLAVLTYHSLEEKIVKEFLLKFSGKCYCPPPLPVCACGSESRRPKIKILPSSGSMPTKEEKSENPASRSAHLRAAEVILK